MTSKKWHILFCDQDSRLCPVEEFIEACQPRHQVKILRFLTLLEEHGPTLPRPYADFLHDGIHELRIKLSGDHVRLLYFFCYQKFIVLYEGFFKHTSRVPESLIRKALKYRDLFMKRTSRPHLEAIVHADA